MLNLPTVHVPSAATDPSQNFKDAAEFYRFMADDGHEGPKEKDRKSTVVSLPSKRNFKMESDSSCKTFTVSGGRRRRREREGEGGRDREAEGKRESVERKVNVNILHTFMYIYIITDDSSIDSIAYIVYPHTHTIIQLSYSAVDQGYGVELSNKDPVIISQVSTGAQVH